MKKSLRPMMRRELLETGIFGGAMIALLPLQRFFILPANPDFLTKSAYNFSEESLEKLSEIASKYGSEFAEIYPKFEKETGSAKTKSRIRRSSHGRV
jgi:hypothetical protein